MIKRQTKNNNKEKEETVYELKDESFDLTRIEELFPFIVWMYHHHHRQ